MKKMVYALIALATFASGIANAEVRGARSCGVWVADRNNSDKMRASVDFTWLIGYLSGLGVGGQSIAEYRDFLKGADNESIALWMDNYCKAHPLESISTGANILSFELAKKTVQGPKG